MYGHVAMSAPRRTWGERVVVVQDGGLELDQARSRIDAELFDEER